MAERYDCLIIGGGVVGLSLARELAGRGRRVAVVERGALGREASWAGAGMLPPANRATALHPLDLLRGLSYECHSAWAAELREETGIDTGFRRCGAIYVAGSPGESAALRGEVEVWRDEQIDVQPLDRDKLRDLASALLPARDTGRIRNCYWLPGECQLRNPWHLKALAASCRHRGVGLWEQATQLEFQREGERIVGLQTAVGSWRSDQYCITAGAWSYPLLHGLGIETGILPIRGQIVLFSCPRPPLRPIVNEGSRYLVPREDGHVLVGSTEEEVGYCKETTGEAISALTRFARELLPELSHARIERAWAGLRPGSFDGFPYLGRVPGHDNLFVAAGHFRSGLYLSPGTAVVMAQLMCGDRPEIDLTPFGVLRS